MGALARSLFVDGACGWSRQTSVHSTPWRPGVWRYSGFRLNKLLPNKRAPRGGFFDALAPFLDELTSQKQNRPLKHLEAGKGRAGTVGLLDEVAAHTGLNRKYPCHLMNKAVGPTHKKREHHRGRKHGHKVDDASRSLELGTHYGVEDSFM